MIRATVAVCCDTHPVAIEGLRVILAASQHFEVCDVVGVIPPLVKNCTLTKRGPLILQQVRPVCELTACPKTKGLGQEQIGLADARKQAFHGVLRNGVFGQGAFQGWPPALACNF
jgi:hypothetical protein